ncbi:MAG: ABC transporter ATP-binding protein [Alphaproteobacteria bacterium]|jgi:putative ABC transport system ATP-binding protein|nr:ABC transporter ATP-binding protein [Alphaproteobacteria bacterium]MBF0355934.1 ABC transporter ATP-binding protein [Alphaproteobacteria bacterium]
MNQPAIHLRGIHLKLASDAGEVNILNGIDLSVGRQETLGIVGPSGSGKSSLMMVMAGLERPSQGQVHVLGQDLKAMSEDALSLFRRRHVGIVFQSFHLIPTMTALENVAIPLELSGQRTALKKAAELLERVGLKNRQAHYPAQLSGGEQQRVALARAFSSGPGLLLADEPTGNLDQTTGDGVIELLFDLNRNNAATLILITHDQELAKRCMRVIHLKDGRLEGNGA